MLVTRRPEGLVLVTQVDHQDHCGAMARLWGGGEFGAIDDWESVRTAAGCHDEGWRTVDERPELDARGLPVDFPDVDRARHVEIAGRSIDAALASGPRVGLLVSMHYAGLYQRRLGLDGPAPVEHVPAVAEFLAREEARQEGLRATLGDDLSLSAWAWDAYRLLQAWDSLSLYLAWRGLAGGLGGILPRVPRGAFDDGVDVRVEPLGRFTASCDPFPFLGEEVELPVAARVIEDRPYRDDDDLRSALALAATITLECVVCRRPGG